MKLYAIPIAILAVGLLLAYGYRDAPRFTSDDWYAAVPYKDSHRYYEQRRANLNPDRLLGDAGVGLASLGLSLTVGLAILRVSRFSDLKALKTPSARWVLFALSNVAWYGLIRAEMDWLPVLLERREYPPWGDTMAIPAFGLMFLFMVGLVLINIGLAICLLGSRLPAALWAHPHGTRAWVMSAILTLVAVGVLLSVIPAVQAGHKFEIPALLLIAYLLICGRAAIAGAHSNKSIKCDAHTRARHV